MKFTGRAQGVRGNPKPRKRQSGHKHDWDYKGQAAHPKGSAFGTVFHFLCSTCGASKTRSDAQLVQDARLGQRSKYRKRRPNKLPHKREDATVRFDNMDIPVVPGTFMVTLSAPATPGAPSSSGVGAPAVALGQTLAQVSTVVRSYIEYNDVGSTNYYGGDSGAVYDDRAKRVARISFNGRVWPPDEVGPDLEITGDLLQMSPSEFRKRRRKNPSDQLVHRWQTRGGKYWIELWQYPDGGYRYAGTGGGGTMGDLPYDQVMAEIQQKINAAALYHGRTLRLVDPEKRRSNPGLAILNPPRRNNPGLAILNPLPEKLQTFAREQQLAGAELEEFNKAIAKYCEFHGVSAEEIGIEQIGETDGDETKFLVGIGATEDVSYSANHKHAYKNSNKRGVAFRHEFPSKPHMATTPDGDMILIVNRAGGKQFIVSDWMRG